MVTTVCYKVNDLSPHAEDASASLEDILNHQAEEGWKLVTGLQPLRISVTHAPEISGIEG
jgi:hypothetical protein